MRLDQNTLDQIFDKATGAEFRGVRNLGIVTDVTVNGVEYRVVINGRNLAYVDTASQWGNVDYVSGGNATPAQHAALTA